MSKPYVVRIKETARRHIVVEDGVEARLEVLEILGKESTSRLLGEELARRGFTVDDGVATKTDADGVVLRVDIEERKVHLGKREEANLEHTVERTERGWDDVPHKGMTERARAEGERALDAETTRRAQEITSQLERKLGDVRAELDEVVVRVTQQALRIRAAQIGEVESVEEDAETGSMTIRVRV
jgi:hypothetical protein